MPGVGGWASRHIPRRKLHGRGLHRGQVHPPGHVRDPVLGPKVSPVVVPDGQRFSRGQADVEDDPVHFIRGGRLPSAMSRSLKNLPWAMRSSAGKSRFSSTPRMTPASWMRVRTS